MPTQVGQWIGERVASGRYEVTAKLGGAAVVLVGVLAGGLLLFRSGNKTPGS